MGPCFGSSGEWRRAFLLVALALGGPTACLTSFDLAGLRTRDGGAEVVDDLAPDHGPVDAGDVADAGDVEDALDAADAFDAEDVSDGEDALDIVDVPPDTGTCGGPLQWCCPGADGGAGTCRSPSVCSAGVCVPCPSPWEACGSTCANLSSDPQHCGTCENRCRSDQTCNGICLCPMGTTNCTDQCVNLATSLDHCGSCGHACLFPHATAGCESSHCRMEACLAGYANCDGDPTTGCEAPLATSTMHCGLCGNLCTFANALATCVDGACVMGICTTGWGDCNSNPADGCETNLLTSPTNCGMCGNECTAPEGSSAACRSGMCAVAMCLEGRGDCNEMVSGCETDLTTNLLNCGTCGNSCSFPHAGAECVASACVMRACTAGWGDCNGSAVDGCETNVQTTPAHCGACGMACSLPGATAGCAAGMCTVASCAMDRGDCDGMAANGCEVDLLTTVAHCGTCSTVCMPANATPTCVMGACGLAGCNASFGDCDGNAANGCEVDLRTTPAHCGACGSVCSVAHATSMCTAGACVMGVCLPGWGNCDGVSGNGCETDVLASLDHCGTCGTVCTPLHASGHCDLGICGVGICQVGWGNCDGMAANGCEINLLTNAGNCGSCGHACSAGQYCSAGGCVDSCPSGQMLCGGACVNVQTDIANCGGCGVVCPAPMGSNATATCAAGHCGFTCLTNFADCDLNAANYCEVNTQTDVAHCGGCGLACVLPHATPACSSGTCVVASCLANWGNCTTAPGCETSLETTAHCGACGVTCSFAHAAASCPGGACTMGACNAGFANCDGNTANGCEVNLTNDPAHCGSCTTMCPTYPFSTPTCVARTCGIACNPGRGNCDGSVTNGCETDTATSVLHCGGCGMRCFLRNARAACMGGTCRLAFCESGYANCDGDASNGCETRLSSTLNCGQCSRACVVAAGEHRIAACTSRAGNEDYACNVSICQAGYRTCATGGTADGGTTQYCAINLRSPDSCQGCTAHCGLLLCGPGGCQLTCGPGQGWCRLTSLSTESACVDLRTDPDHCGSCLHACPNTPNMAGRCQAGACQECPADLGNCDGDATNGCETDLQTDDMDCGGCGMHCSSSTWCSRGHCCMRPRSWCPLPAGCVDLATDPDNCGTCGTSCLSRVCRDGMCDSAGS